MVLPVKLYLPVLFPSWRFFGEIGASPRIAFRSGNGPWIPATDRPQALSLTDALRRLIWNGDWNETLFLVSLAERFLIEKDQAVLAEIARRVALRHKLIGVPEIRISLVTGSSQHVAYESMPDVT